MRSRGEGLEDERGRSGAATAARRSDTGGWKPMSLRTRRGLALLATFLFVAAACTTGASPTPQPTATAPGATAPPAATSANLKSADVAAGGPAHELDRRPPLQRHVPHQR